LLKEYYFLLEKEKKEKKKKRKKVRKYSLREKEYHISITKV
jgi:hypothetical protein